MDRCAGPCWGTGPSSEGKKRTERLFMFHLELPSAGDPRTTPPGSCVACGRTHARSRSRQRTHKTRPAHARPLKPFTTDQSCVSLGDLASRLSSPASCRCRGPRGRPPLAALNPPLTGMFILRAVTFRSFRRDCVFSQRSLSTVYKHSDTGSSVY